MKADTLGMRLLAMAGCGIVAYCLRHLSTTIPPFYWYAIGAGIASFALSEQILPPSRPASIIRTALDATWRLLAVALLLSAAAYGLKISDTYSRLWSVLWLGSSWAVIVALAATAPQTRQHRPLILVGTPEAVRKWRTSPASERHTDIRVVPPSQLLPWLQENGELPPNAEILLLGHIPEAEDRTALILALHGNPIPLRYCVDPDELLTVDDTAMPLLPPPKIGDDLIKRTMDLILGSLALVVCAPLMAVIALVIRQSGSGPVLFRQRRLGMGGHAFTIYKFRTMVPEAGDQADAPQAHPEDTRVTTIGMFLRRWGLDELPQLFNVLKGEMSLVGPRPHALPHDMHWGAQLPRYAQRFRLRPGITGLAQTRGERGYADSLDDIAFRLESDLEYIRTWSPLLDMRLLLRTLPYLLRHAGTEAASMAAETAGQDLREQENQETGIAGNIARPQP